MKPHADIGVALGRPACTGPGACRCSPRLPARCRSQTRSRAGKPPDLPAEGAVVPAEIADDPGGRTTVVGDAAGAGASRGPRRLIRSSELSRIQSRKGPVAGNPSPQARRLETLYRGATNGAVVGSQGCRLLLVHHSFDCVSKLRASREDEVIGPALGVIRPGAAPDEAGGNQKDDYSHNSA
jgi:hypothetical protein